MLDRQAALTEINLDDFTAGFGLQDRPRLARLARRVMRGPAERFARRIVDFDDATEIRGLPEAARQLEARFALDVRVHGRERLPKGAFLALSNHPGLTDTLALFAALDRRDLMTIALDRPFLVSLVNVGKHILYLTDAPHERSAVVRRAARMLREGGSVLTFPAGRIEPDPEAFPGAADSLINWTRSAEVFLRLAPGTPVVPICVRGVTWRAAARIPKTRRWRTADEHQLLASGLQLIWQLISGARLVKIQVQIGDPISMSVKSDPDAVELHRSVLAEMRKLIGAPPPELGESVL